MSGPQRKRAEPPITCAISAESQWVILQTDHRNLTYLMNLKEPNGRLGRWVMRLSEHQFAIEYRKGKYMEISDCMSRNPQEKTTDAPEAAPEFVTER